MYNAVVKESFVVETMSAAEMRYTARGFFNAIEEEEIKAGKDIAQMSEGEVDGIINSVKVGSLGRLYIIRSILNGYIKWCIKNEVFDDISSGILSAMSTKDISLIDARVFIKDAEDLYTSMRKVREFDNGWPEPVILCFAWVGLDRKTAFFIQEDQVNIDRGEIYDLAGGIIATWDSPEITDVLTQYVNCKEGTRDYKQGSYKVKKDYSGNLFLKRFVAPTSERLGETYTGAQLTSGLARFSERYKNMGLPNRLTFKNVWESGRLYAIHLLEESGVDVNDRKNQSLVYDTFQRVKPVRNILWQYEAYKKEYWEN